MIRQKPAPLSLITLKSTASVLCKSGSTHWMHRGFSLSRRQRPRTRCNSRALALFVFAFFASSCIVYHFVTFKYSITKILEKCDHKDISREQIAGDTSGGSGDGSVQIPILIDTVQHVPHHQLQRRLPQCIIIGVRKCGTRALLEFLNIHPSVEKAPDEVHYFDDDTKYYLGLDWYRRQMPYSSPEQVTIEKTPAYFITDSVPQRIHDMNSSIKLIIIVRDPVTRLISDYVQLAANKAKKVRRMTSFEDSVLLPDGRVNTSYKAVRISIYAIFYSRWTRVFSPNQVHIVDGDRLVYEPFPEVQKVEQFLGLSHRINRDNFSYNTTKGFYCVKINGTIERCLNESKGRRHPEINPLVVQTLRRFYAPVNRQFYKLVGRDFGWPEI